MQSHQFEHDINGCIIHDITNVDGPSFVKCYRINNLLDQSRHGWPFLNFKTEEEFYLTLKEKDLKIYDIMSSYGLSGWIFAKDMRIIVNGEDLTERNKT